MTRTHISAAALWTVLSFTAFAQTPAAPPTAPPATRPNERVSVRPVIAEDLAKPAAADWLTYHGSYTGNHYSTLTQIDTRNVANLRRAWVSDTDAAAASGGRGGGGGRGSAPAAPVP